MRGRRLSVAIVAAIWGLAPFFVHAAPPQSGAPQSGAPRQAAEAAAVTAQDREHWAFQKVHRPRVPALSDHANARTPIDAFLLAKLAEKKLALSPPADKPTLLRRAYLDLHGLPPSPQEVAEFVADPAPDAFARRIDRLLASPRFGERWGRHWLDVVGYADTVGFDTDANGIIVSAGKWKYRDYVIAAFNADKPYDRFLTEQLAGDELVDWRHAAHFTPEIRDDLIATGYLRTARDQTHEPESNIPLNYYGVLHDTVEMLGSSLFALTVNCARCHSHKFDPIPQRDYYRLMALFTPAYNPQHWKPVFPWKPEIKDRAIADVSPAEQAEIEQANLAVDRDVAAIHSRMSEPHCTPQLKATLKQRIAERSAARRQYGHIQALYDVGPAPATYLLKRGQFETPGPEVEPGFLSVLCDADREAVAAAHSNGPDSGRRLAFARWLTHKDSRAAALVARVMVNRIWQHLFGQGLVRTPENFGAQGESPTHPELLDWLAADFMTNFQWQLKPVIRELMLSAAYQQSSVVGHAASLPVPRISKAGSPPDPAKLDPDNKLLWRMPAKRLEAEVIRDCILATSGRLNSVMGGPPILLVARPDGLVVVDDSKLKRPADANKRSVYLLSRRAYNLSLLTVFDRPLFAVNCPKRDASVIPLQSLTMLNDEFVADEAVHFAARVASESPPASSEEIRRAFSIALCRLPNHKEEDRCTAYLDRQRTAFKSAGVSDREANRQALTELCHTLLNTSEFLYSE
jgi:Protein of unknown function (DUF1553)/Protein of unknown function (DUF1549)